MRFAHWNGSPVIRRKPVAAMRCNIAKSGSSGFTSYNGAIYASCASRAACNLRTGTSRGVHPSRAAMAANVPAACPVSRTTGCRRVEPLIRFETDIALSETTRLSVPAGIITPIGTENDGTGGKGIFPI